MAGNARQHMSHTWQSSKKILAPWETCPVCMAIQIATSTWSSTTSLDCSNASSYGELRRHDAHVSKSWEGCAFPACSDSEPDRDWTTCSKLYTPLKVFSNARNSLRWGSDLFSVNMFKQLLPTMVRMGWKKGNILSSVGLEPGDVIRVWLRSSIAHAASRNFEIPSRHSFYKMGNA